MKRFALAFAVAIAGCGGDSSSNCDSTKVEVKYFGGANDGKTECKGIPAPCGATASCAVQACISALYGLCASPYIGVGCSDTFPPTIVSCNP
jgi:hypothetical protein